MKAIVFSIFTIIFGVIASLITQDGAPIIFCVPMGLILLPYAIKYGNRVFDPDFFE